MASKNIKGLIVEIEGKTDGLAKAFADVNKRSKKLGDELKEVNKLLKFDPSNVEGLTQKKKLLSESIELCAEQMRTLTDFTEKYQEQLSEHKEGEEYIRRIKREMEFVTQTSKEFAEQLQGTNVALDRLGDESDDVKAAIDAMKESAEVAKTPFEKFSESMQELNTRSDSLSKELKEIDESLKKSPNDVTLAYQKYDVLQESVDVCAQKLQLLHVAADDVRESFRKGEASADSVRKIERAIIDTTSEMDRYADEARDTVSKFAPFVDAADNAADEVNDLGDKADKAARKVDDLGDKADKTDGEVSGLKAAAEKAGDGFTTLKGIAANLISEALEELVEVLKEVAKYMAQTGMDFESTMSKVEALIDPTQRTAENMEKLTEKAMEMGAKTKFSAGESAEAFQFLAQAGWDVDMMLAGIDGVMNLAATDGIELSAAAEIVADSLNSLGYEAKDAATFADVLAVSAAASSTNVEELGYAFQYVGPLAGALKYDMDDLAVALGLMANAGIKGEKAGTSLRSLFTNLAKPTDAMSDAMEKYGISLTTAEGEMRPLADLMSDLRGVFAGLTEEEKANLAATLAGKTGMAGLLAIVNASDEDFEKMTSAIAGANGAAEEMATIMQDNLAGDVEKLGGAFDTLAIKITDKFNEALRQGVQAITLFLDGEISMTEMLLMLSDSFTMAIQDFKSYLPTLSKMGSELLKFLVDGLVTGLPQLMTMATQLVSKLGLYIAQAAPQIMSVAGSLLTSFVQGIFNFIPQLIISAAAIIGGLAGGITQNTEGFVSKALDLLDGFANKLAGAVPILIQMGMAFIGNLVQGLVNALPEFIARAPEIISKFANIINDNFPTILSKGVGIIWQLIKGIISAIPTLVANIPKIITAIVDVWEAFNWLSLGKKALQAIGNGIKSLWSWLKGIGTSTKDTLVNVIKELPGKLMELGKNAVDDLGGAIKNGWSTVKSGATTLFDKIVGFFKDLPGKLLTIGKDLVKGLWNGISDMTGWIIGKIQSFGSSVLDGIKNFFGIASPSKEFAKIGMYLDQGLAKGLEDNMKDPVKAAKEMAESVLDGAQDIDGFSLENGVRQRSVQMAADVTAKADSAMLSKLDKILTAIESGQVLTLDGKALIGNTATQYDRTLGQRRILIARGAV